MIKEAIRRFYDEYYSSVDFRRWQNEFACNIYAHLKPYSKEVPKVEAMCNVMANRQYHGLQIESRMIHSYAKSGVAFDFMGETVRKELADMAVISLVTYCREIIFLKTAFVQNKNSTDTPDKWTIDPKQLYLLKNFPTFTGTRGIIKDKTFTFLNHSGTLGNFGLFSSKCETIFLTARDTFCNQNGSGVINFGDIKHGATAYNPQFTAQSLCRRWEKHCCFDCMEYNNRNSTKCGSITLGSSLPFFGNYRYALDVYELVRALTYFNIGELSMAHRRIIDDDLFTYTQKLINSAFGYYLGDGKFYRENAEQSDDDEDKGLGVKAVFFNHLELGEK